MQIIHGLEQGSDAWLARRCTTRNASDAPAMMGVSPYVSRSEFIRQRATGIEREVDSATQAIFDRGHAVEPALRALAEAMIGEDLYPVVADSDDGYLSASLDGVTLAEDVIFEGKQSNAAKQACIARDEIPPQDYWQVVQQFAVCEAATRCLYACGDGTESGTSTLWIERSRVEHDIPKLRAGWQQADADIAAYEPEPAKAAVVASPVAGFGALSIRVEGRVLASNLDTFKANAEAFLAQLPKPADLQTDQDFADADAAVKACAEAESRIKAAQDAALGEMEDIDTLLRTVGSISEAIRAARLALEKAVKAEKDNRRQQIVDAGVRAVRDHYDTINATLGQHRIQPPQSLAMDIGLAIKGKKSLASMQDAVGTSAANAKIAASQQADRVRACVHVLEMEMGDYAALFPDRVALCASKAPEDLRNLVTARIAEHQQREQARLDAQREQIRKEEEARAQRLQQEAEAERQRVEQLAQEQEQAALAAEPAPEPVSVPAAAGTSAPVQSPALAYSTPAAAPAVSAPQRRLKLGEIQALIAPLSICAHGLAELGFLPVTIQGASKLYDAAQYPRMAAAMQQRLADSIRNAEQKAAA